MQPHRPIPPEPPNPFEASTPTEAVQTEPPCPAPVDEPILPQAVPAIETPVEMPAEPAAAPNDAETLLAKAIARLAETETRRIEAEARATEQHDAWLRAKAETENVRRRAQEDITKASKFAAEKFAGAMLPVKDSLEAALSAQSQTLEALREGVEVTLKQLIAAFEGASLAEEDPLGKKFDPNKHQAIGTLESDAEPNTVINVLQKGYLLHERVIRPAMVMVSRAKA